MANKKIPATVFVSGLGSDICNPFFNKDGRLHVVRQNQGTILQLDAVGNARPLVATNGQPSSCVFSPDGILYTTDFAHMAVLAYTEDGQQEMVVSVYEDKPLKGPNGIALIDGDVFFTDSGPFGETGLHAPLGSLFVISNSPSGQILKPISLNNLAYPAGIVVTKDKKFIYVAETMQNRVLRFFQRPAGVYHGSVFYTMSGGVGPSSLALDSHGNLYVGQFDVKECTNEGQVLVLSSVGKVLRTFTVTGPEISGLTILDDVLYITERSSGSIYKADI